MCAWGFDAENASFSRSKWILVESLRRYVVSDAVLSDQTVI